MGFFDLCSGPHHTEDSYVIVEGSRAFEYGGNDQYESRNGQFDGRNGQFDGRNGQHAQERSAALECHRHNDNGNCNEDAKRGFSVQGAVLGAFGEVKDQVSAVAHSIYGTEKAAASSGQENAAALECHRRNDNDNCNDGQHGGRDRRAEDGTALDCHRNHQSDDGHHGRKGEDSTPQSFSVQGAFHGAIQEVKGLVSAVANTLNDTEGDALDCHRHDDCNDGRRTEESQQRPAWESWRGLPPSGQSGAPQCHDQPCDDGRVKEGDCDGQKGGHEHRVKDGAALDCHRHDDCDDGHRKGGHERRAEESKKRSAWASFRGMLPWVGHKNGALECHRHEVPCDGDRKQEAGTALECHRHDECDGRKDGQGHRVEEGAALECHRRNDCDDGHHGKDGHHGAHAQRAEEGERSAWGSFRGMMPSWVGHQNDALECHRHDEPCNGDRKKEGAALECHRDDDCDGKKDGHAHRVQESAGAHRGDREALGKNVSPTVNMEFRRGKNDTVKAVFARGDPGMSIGAKKGSCMCCAKVAVTNVAKGGQAEKLGVKAGWEVVSVHDTEVSGLAQGSKLMAKAFEPLPIA